jgi:hypothetical protein
MMAYIDILNLPQDQQGELLDKLAPVFADANTSKVQKARTMLEQVAKDRNGKIYAETEAYLTNISDNDMDIFTKGYLLGELTSWGRQFVFTTDYIQGVDALIQVSKAQSYASYSRALSFINKVSNDESKNYLLSELDNYKKYYNISEPNNGLVELVDFYSLVGDEKTEIIKKLIASVDENPIIQVGKYDDSRFNLLAYKGASNGMNDIAGFIIVYDKDSKAISISAGDLDEYDNKDNFIKEFVNIFPIKYQSEITNDFNTMLQDRNNYVSKYKSTILKNISSNKNQVFYDINRDTSYGRRSQEVQVENGYLYDLIKIYCDKQ